MSLIIHLLYITFVTDFAFSNAYRIALLLYWNKNFEKQK